MNSARVSLPVRVDSVAEEYAYVAVNPPAEGHWEVVSQTMGAGEHGVQDVLLARSASGEERTFRFDIGTFHGTTGLVRLGEPTTGFLGAVMEKAASFAKGTGAHHPGSLPRFPVPSDRYPGRLDVPLPILALDAGMRGVFAPVRVVTMGYEDAEPFGVGEYPGFDPDEWPPPRLGDWPPPGTAGFDRMRLQAAISRFSAVAVRLFDAWFDDRRYLQLDSERAEFIQSLGVLDLPAMMPYYRQVGAKFFDWAEAD